ncbi:MAG: phosphatidylglycerophosphatase A [Nitrospirota bacterium]
MRAAQPPGGDGDAVQRRWAWWVATAGGVGAAPWAPGTAGSLVGAAVGWAAGRLLGPGWYVVGTAALFGLGVAVATRVERTTGRKDPSVVVIDEVVGMLVALFALPLRAGDVLIAFLCFRIFDIAKPFPLRRLEAQPGGWGIMLDDLVAGLYTNVLVRIGLWAAGVV